MATNRTNKALLFIGISYYCLSWWPTYSTRNISLAFGICNVYKPYFVLRENIFSMPTLWIVILVRINATHILPFARSYWAGSRERICSSNWCRLKLRDTVTSCNSNGSGSSTPNNIVFQCLSNKAKRDVSSAINNLCRHINDCGLAVDSGSGTAYGNFNFGGAPFTNSSNCIRIPSNSRT